MKKLITIWLLLVPVLLLADDFKPLPVEVLWQMERIGSPVISPTGGHVVAPVTAYKVDDDSSTTRLWLFSSDGQTTPQGGQVSNFSYTFTADAGGDVPPPAELCSVVGQDIPDNNAQGLSNTLSVTQPGSITDLDVLLDIDHTWVGNLIVDLVHTGSATSFRLVNRPGASGADPFGCSGDNIKTILDDDAVPSIQDNCETGTAFPQARYRPANALSQFAGLSLSGNWTLTVSDNADGDVGQLVRWCLQPTTAGNTDLIFADGFEPKAGPEHVYTTVIIGTQEWMAENLRETKYNNGDDIPTGLDGTQWGDALNGAYAIYPHSQIDGLDSDAEVLDAYGALYNWYAVVDPRGLCPSGWRVATDADWTVLTNYVVEQGFPNEPDNPNGAGNALKSCWQVDHPDGADCDTSEHPRWDSNATHTGFDEFGFSALPGGRRWFLGDPFEYGGGYGMWWSSTDIDFSFAWTRAMGFTYDQVPRYGANKRFGHAVRCVRDID